MLYIGKEVTVTDAMVTGRMPERKKQQGLRVLKRDGMNASQAVNLLFDRLIEEGSGTAAMVLEANEVKLDRLLALVEQLVSSYQNTATKERAVGIGGALCRQPLAQALNTVRRYDEGRDQA